MHHNPHADGNTPKISDNEIDLIRKLMRHPIDDGKYPEGENTHPIIPPPIPGDQTFSLDAQTMKVNTSHPGTRQWLASIKARRALVARSLSALHQSPSDKLETTFKRPKETIVQPFELQYMAPNRRNEQPS